MSGTIPSLCENYALYIPVAISPYNLYYESLRGYTPSYWIGNPFDGAGIVMVNYGGSIGIQYNPTTIAQYGLSLWNDYLDTGNLTSKTKFLLMADWLNTNIDSAGGYPYNFPIPRYGLLPGWISAIAQGQAMSVLVRAYSITFNSAYLNSATRAKDRMLLPVASGGTFAQDPEGEAWLEEYPSVPASNVYNGFIFAVIGLYDYSITVPSDKGARVSYVSFARSIDRAIGYYDTGTWLLYDRRFSEPVQANYITIQKNQMNHLFLITGDQFYKNMAIKWSAY